jgi:hypothetical protein
MKKVTLLIIVAFLLLSGWVFIPDWRTVDNPGVVKTATIQAVDLTVTIPNIPLPTDTPQPSFPTATPAPYE